MNVMDPKKLRILN